MKVGASVWATVIVCFGGAIFTVLRVFIIIFDFVSVRNNMIQMLSTLMQNVYN